MRIHLGWIPIFWALAMTGQSYGEILEIEVTDVIHPIVREYVVGGIQSAEASGANAVILRLSTPGGLDQSMREIIEKILSSRVPVIAFVAPSGARAASAGFFILLSADLAVMAPGTNTGAAHPVAVTGGNIDEVMKRKVENDAAAYIRSFVAKRGRNSQLAEKGVIESKSFTETEALENNLIDAIARNTDEIIARFDGREITRFNGDKQVLKLKGETLSRFEMSRRQKLLSRVLNPNIALILGLIGLLGLYVEFTNPGLIFPGVAGAVCIFLALVAFNILPVNVLGIVLILTAIVLFILEAKLTSYGLLAALGIAAMVMGAMILVESPVPELRVQLKTAIGVTLPFAAVSIFLLRLVILSHQRKTVTGQEGMVGELGVALSDLEPEGKVRVHGEIWQAVSDQPIRTGETVRILRVEGLKITVGKA
ncbi:MAG: nodulation protein NfeD [Acidobacteriota bacterium]